MQANLWEARSSRENADETARQGNVGIKKISPCLGLTNWIVDPPRIHSCDDHLCK